MIGITDLLDTLRNEVCGTVEHQETPLELGDYVKLYDNYYMRALGVYVARTRVKMRGSEFTPN